MDWRQILMPPETTVLNALQVIDSGAVQIALVVDENQKLLGTVTDGDIRRGILAGYPLDVSVKKVMNSSPVVAKADQSSEAIAEQMQALELLQLPVVNESGKVIAVRFLKDILKKTQSNNLVVLMAGGFGTRLKPLTNDCPKPMLHVGGKPILHGIVERFASHGFTKFVISVHYKAQQITEYFGNGARFGVDISYIHEKEALGTAGALKLLPEIPKEPFFVMNGDLITSVNFKQLLAFHNQQAAEATMCVQPYDFKIPFGVVNVEENSIQRVEEKPLKSFLVNAGIYVLDPCTLECLENRTRLEMPDFFNILIDQGSKAAAFAIHEKWLDIGRPEDFVKASHAFSAVI
ncbi:MAG: nucleotidyltransferase family protein [Candidatus Melainabacteria bacterium]|nr:MAG: nucleotidyltransferase family protein [Candidatus Melainabacteria bacterium]